MPAAELREAVAGQPETTPREVSARTAEAIGQSEAGAILTEATVEAEPTVGTAERPRAEPAVLAPDAAKAKLAADVRAAANSEAEPLVIGGSQTAEAVERVATVDRQPDVGTEALDAGSALTDSEEVQAKALRRSEEIVDVDRIDELVEPAIGGDRVQPL